MNNKLKNKTKQQLISEINKLQMLNDEQFDKLREVNVNYARTRQENKHLKENLDLADSDYRELRRDYEYAREMNKGNERTFVWFTFSALFNAVFIAIIVMLLNR